jgi:hypothetical protein
MVRPRLQSLLKYAYFTDLLIAVMFALLLASADFPFSPVGLATGIAGAALAFGLSLLFLENNRLGAARAFRTCVHFVKLVLMLVAFSTDNAGLVWLLVAFYSSEACVAYLAGRKRGKQFTQKELYGRQ